jgi:hypothetical protein
MEVHADVMALRFDTLPDALLSPNIALSQTIEEWIDHFQRTGDGKRGMDQEKECVKELVEFLFRVSSGRVNGSWRG